MEKPEKLRLVSEKIKECQKCPVLVANRTQAVPGHGNPYAEIAIIGEAGGQQEDEKGIPFCGKSGQLLDNILKSCNIERNDVFVLNICCCRPPNNRPPTPTEAENCRPFLDLQLKIVNPKYIMCLGTSASQYLLRMPVSITSVRGTWFKYENHPVNAKVMLTFHPSYALRCGETVKKKIYDDFQMLLKDRSLHNKNLVL